MIYELWDTRSQNVIGEFDTRAAALNAVLEAVTVNHDDTVAATFLLFADNGEAVVAVAGGTELLGLARAVVERVADA